METITAEVTGEHVLKTRCRRPRIARTLPRLWCPRPRQALDGCSPGIPGYGKASSLVGYSTPRPPPSFVGPPPRQCRPQGAVRLVAIAADARIVEGEGEGPRRHRYWPQS